MDRLKITIESHDGRASTVSFFATFDYDYDDDLLTGIYLYFNRDRSRSRRVMRAKYANTRERRPNERGEM